MKVLHVIDKLDVGGAEKIFISLLNLLYNKIDVSYLSYLGDGELSTYINNKIKRVNYIRNNKYSFKDAKKLAGILKQYDVLHVHMRHNYRYIKLVSFLFNVKTKIILHDHLGVKVNKAVPRFFKNLFKPKYYIGVSEESIIWARTKLKLNKERIYLLENFVHKETNIENTATKKNGLVIVGNIKPVKNMLFAIEIAEKLNKNLTIVGKIQDKEYYNLLLERIEKNKLNKKINFRHDVINVQSILNDYELALMTSVSESGPLVLIEYLAQNLPFVTYKTGEVVKQVENDLKELIVENFKKEEWVNKVRDILENPPKNLNIIYSNTFNSKKYVNKCIEIYQKILNY